ncbi:MAG: hypothetical protein ISS02_01710 [Candidatus Portnoybacteria bacterium]|nr:hypothetical protein [Candidatus Portnoybacteria bacterium]
MTGTFVKNGGFNFCDEEKKLSPSSSEKEETELDELEWRKKRMNRDESRINANIER